VLAMTLLAHEGVAMAGEFYFSRVRCRTHRRDPEPTPVFVKRPPTPRATLCPSGGGRGLPRTRLLQSHDPVLRLTGPETASIISAVRSRLSRTRTPWPANQEVQLRLSSGD